MHRYTQAQLEQYFQHIGYTPKSGDVSLAYLADLQKYHLARVPFESVTLHYSKARLLSLDPEDLFVKIVGNSRGGYCMEVNAFFATVLRSLGFALITAGGRVKGEHAYSGWSHMVNIVIIEGKRYLVDVGFGANDPPRPVLLEHGIEFDTIYPAKGKLEYKAIADYTDASQRVWVYSSRENGGAPWVEQNCFVDHEFLPQDFEVMNLQTMTSPASFFVKTVVATRTVLDEPGQRAVGVMILHNDYVKQRLAGRSETLENLETEEQRVVALEKYFQIVLSAEQQSAIRGLATELKRTLPVPHDA